MSIRKSWPDVPYGLALGLGPLCWVMFGVAGLAHWPQWTPPRSGQWLAGIDTRLLLLSVLIAPLLEEIVFRGGLQHWLRRRPGFARSRAGVSLANGCTSVVFSSVHLINQPPLMAAAVFLPSLVFGWAFDRYGRILPCIVLHGFYNAGFLVFVA